MTTLAERMEGVPLNDTATRDAIWDQWVAEQPYRLTPKMRYALELLTHGPGQYSALRTGDVLGPWPAVHWRTTRALFKVGLVVYSQRGMPMRVEITDKGRRALEKSRRTSAST
jgi:hypothetical protein